ncbi:MAG TPA: ribosome-associated translation inhibitor RaiA [Bacillota bacterium]|nr:ribosome-associated translation inhibitor RaiA [Bacillota bacterium]HOK68096.1 ribosome-associated translation inhibitor RaiA [Bacillota bacterium]HPP84398.1 ribosome-associated translation inhibitor RaiA [Bacillota bacterium]
MTTRIIARKFTVNDEVKAWLQKKLKKLDKFFPEDTEVAVTLASQKNGERVELTINRNGAIFRAEEVDRDYLSALERAVDVIERQIRKNRTRLEKKIYIKKDTFTPEEKTEVEDELKISKVKKFDIIPMTVEEAILQMNLLSHSFFLFKNAETGNLNVVYKRKENDYGLIEPLD